MARHQIKDDKISVDYNGNSYEFDREEFNRKPKGVMQKIINIKVDASNWAM